jgi:4-amino-4-deoxy-L-arabinose transferase-like glycosyltransferase
MRKMKIIRVASAVVLIVAGAACAWFWWTAFNQQAELAMACTGIQTPEELANQFPVFSAALDMLKVNIFSPSDDPMSVISKLNSQLWRRTLLGVALLLAGIFLLLLSRSQSKSKRMVLITGRVIIALLFCFSCFLIWWSWQNRNSSLPGVEIDESLNRKLHIAR